MWRNVLYLTKFFPVELVFGLLITGAMAGNATKFELFVVIVICIITGVFRGVYLHDRWLEAGLNDDDFVDSEKPDGLSADLKPVAPWLMVNDLMRAARATIPERASVTATSLKHLVDALIHFKALVSEMSCVLWPAASDEKGFFDAHLTSAAHSLCEIEVSVGRWLPHLELQAVRLSLGQAAVAERGEYDPMWEGVTLDQNSAASTLRELTELTRSLIAMSVSMGHAGDDAFEASILKTDEIRNPYGLIDVNPNTGDWPKASPVDYGAIYRADLASRHVGVK